MVYLDPSTPEFEAALDTAAAEQKQSQRVLQDSQEAADSEEHEMEAKRVCSMVQSFAIKHMLRYDIPTAIINGLRTQLDVCCSDIDQISHMSRHPTAPEKTRLRMVDQATFSSAVVFAVDTWINDRARALRSSCVSDLYCCM